MSLPYKIVSFMEGRVQVKSDFFKYICVSEAGIESYIKSHFSGVISVKVSKKTGRVTVEYDPASFDVKEFFSFLASITSETVLDMLSQWDKENGNEQKEEETGEAKRRFILNSLAMGFGISKILPVNALSALTLALAMPVFKKAYNSLKQKKIDVYFLDSSAIAILALRGTPISSLLMVWLLSLGDYIEEMTQGSAHKAIRELLDYKNEEAWLVKNGSVERVSVELLEKGDKVVVYTGEKITVDGVVYDGEGLVNQASLTGESNPVLKKKGDKVYAGTYLEDGKLYVIAEKVGDETALAKIVKIIEESAAEQLQLQEKAEELANKAVIPTLALASYAALTGNLERATATLIVDYHTGIHVSTPVAVMSHMAYAAKKGILFKSGRYLEIMHKVDTVVFDKTGTLTIGHPTITEVVPLKVSEEEVIQIAATLEQRLTHPVAKAVVAYAKERNIELLKREDSQYYMGLGVEAKINGVTYYIGSSKFMEHKGIKIPQRIMKFREEMHKKGESVLYLVRGKVIIGLIGFTDPPRKESKFIVETLHSLGREVILCTGDNEGAAALIAQKLGIKKYYARAFPDEKARIIKELKKQGKVVAFLGDGVNDSPALSVADVGISIRSGADIAIEVADVVINESLCNLVEAFEISDLAMRNIEENYKINTIANTLGLVGSFFGFINPVVATLINNGTTILIGLNALKPMWKKKFREIEKIEQQCEMFAY
ncbi:heavy metal translocating P-type ATPase [Desulfurobacterium atlanticum]|uniref:Cu2+-exporting ATPase n=1 Tax=Desulfurobacterium atlanticum TaxID=240169 RepID=A0A238XV50_9BACT|nr:heavy metal translocating P-type ATPase [Desulfurobacterium atlanticum]SNR61879.1 Cu2+-exporting ATPase [Desulfurobacterium atlanticum]